MLQVLLQLPRAIERDGAVTRVDDARGQLPHPPERAKVGREVALGRVDDARSPPENRVSGEQRAVPFLEVRDVVGAVAGRGDRGQRQLTSRGALPVRNAIAAL